MKALASARQTNLQRAKAMTQFFSKMRFIEVLAAWAAVVACSPLHAETVLTFEGQVAPGGYTQALTDYGGLTWVNVEALNNSPTLDGTSGGYIAGAVSGTTVAFSGDPGGDVTS